MGLSQLWSDSISNCISTVSYFILLNLMGEHRVNFLHLMVLDRAPYGTRGSVSDDGR